VSEGALLNSNLDTYVYVHKRERIRERFNFIRFQKRQQFPYATIAFIPVFKRKLKCN